MMTTNYTHILNENLDMFDEGNDYSVLDYEDDWSEDDWSEDDWNEDDWNETFSFLTRLHASMNEIVERCGVYGAEEWAEVAAVYSDVHKDLYGYRPQGIGLFYHGFTIKS